MKTPGYLPVKMTLSIFLHTVCVYIYIGGFHNVGTPNGWFIMEKPTKLDDLGVPLFQETFINIYIFYT